MSEHLIAARAALADEIADAQTRIARANAALAVLGGDVVPGPLPLVRPPADDVPAPPVELPKREVRPKPAEQRPAAQRGGSPQKWDYDECAAIARTAITAGQSATGALVEQLGMTPQTANFTVSNLRKKGYDIPYARKPFTAEPITRMPVNEQAVRDASAGEWAGPVKPITIMPVGQRPAPRDERTVTFDVDDALAAIEAASA